MARLANKGSESEIQSDFKTAANLYQKQGDRTQARAVLSLIK
jgi:hypothetical protein